MRMTESRLRQIIKSILLEGGIPQLSSFPAEDYDLGEVERFNEHWVKYDPDVTPKGFKPKEGPLHPLLLQRAAKILGCDLKLLLIYLPTRVTDKLLGYDEKTAMQYADGFVRVNPDIVGKNLNGYVFLDDVDDVEIRYLYTCEEQEEEQEKERLNNYWVKVKPALESVGFDPEQDPFDFSAVQAAKLLGCRPEQLLIYLPDDGEGYDEDTAMMYADAYLAKVDPDYAGENMNGYVLLDVIVPGAGESITQRYLYTCEEQEEEQEEEQLKTIKNKNKKQITQENKMRRPTRNPMRLTESRLRQIIRNIIKGEV